MRHSISAERLWQQCQCQYFFSEIMANANARDEKRNTAQFLKKIVSADAWIGKIVHEVIEDNVVPALREENWPTPDDVIPDTLDLARRKYNFSATGQYRYISEQDAGEDFCILHEHYFDRETDMIDVDDACGIIGVALSNLLRSEGMRSFLLGRKSYIAERMLYFDVDGVSIVTKLDLSMPSHDMAGLDIVDWKVASQASNYNYQIAVYAMAALHNNTLPYFSLAQRRVRGYLINLLDEDPSTALVNRYEIDDEALLRTENTLFERIEQIRSIRGDKRYNQLNIASFGLAESPGTCALCNWQKLCLEMKNGRTSQSLPSLKPKTTQLELPFDGDW